MITYRKRRKYKYTLDEDYCYPTGIELEETIDESFLKMETNGDLLIKKGYAWDGATGFPDLKTIIRGSLVHDALYQLMREGKLKQSDRDAADRILEEICINAKMSRWLARRVYQAVKLLGRKAASSTALTAP